MAISQAPALALFDIDGTLLRRSGPHHREALIEAVRRGPGYDTPTGGIPVHGMLDPDTLREMLRQAGAPARVAREAMPAIVASAQRIYRRTCPVLTRRTCPGVRRLLGGLERRGVLMGLVTGNLTRIGWWKLERVGMRRYFRFGAFGEMARDRAGLARLALRRGHQEGWIGAATPVRRIGEAPAFILAARPNGLRSISVATGLLPVEKLKVYEPDLMPEGLCGVRAGAFPEG